jgi:triphosphatase
MRVKRLRYAATPPNSSLHCTRKEVARYLKRLAPAQERLGLLNDVNVALELYRSLVDQAPGAWFAIGRLSAKREALLVECAAALKEFRRTEPLWSRASTH